MTVLGLGVTILLLIGNGLFVGAEFSVIAARRTQLEPMAEDGSRMARIALSAMSQLPLMVAGAQLGITVCTLGLGAISEPVVAHLLEVPFKAVGAPEQLVHPTAFVIALGLVTYLHTVVGEMVPKNIALAGPERAVLVLGPFLLGFSNATKPLLVALKAASTGLLRLAGIQTTESVKTVFTAGELTNLASESRSEGLLAPAAHRRLTAALTLTDRTAKDLVVPWAAVQTVPTGLTPAELEERAVRTGLSRFPVVDQRTREVLGFVHVKDVLRCTDAERTTPLPRSAIRRLPIVPARTDLAALMLLMRRERLHVVQVAESRNSLGVVTLADLLAAVAGGAPAMAT